MSVHIILLMIVRFHFYFLSSLSLLCVHRHYAFDFCFQELFCSVQLSMNTERFEKDEGGMDLALYMV